MEQIDLTTLNDTDLDALRVRTLTEQERRARLAATPEIIRSITDQFLRDGGTLDDALAAVAHAEESATVVDRSAGQ